MIGTVSFSMSELLSAFGGLMNVSTILMMILGVTVGIVCGAMPGISCNMALIMFLPITFSMQSHEAMTLLLAVYTGGMSGGLVSAILLKIPGTPASVATSFDGHPMAQKGEAGKALGVGILSSFIGGVTSCIVLMFLAPALANYAMKFGPFEYLAISIFSLTLIGSLVGDSLIKGMVSALLGMCFSFIGLAPLTSVPRMTFGYFRLESGISDVAMLIGIFAIPELIKVTTEKIDPDQMEVFKFKKVKGFGISMKEYFSHWKNILVSDILGIGIGILPGIGGSIANILAYVTAKKTSKHPEKFGTGIVDGIIAPETANNASIGGALVTMLALGIPCSATTALLIGALSMHGVQPGPMLFLREPQLIYTIFASILISNLIMIVVETKGINIFARMLKIPGSILLPIVVMMCLVGAYAASYSMYDVACVIVFGVLAFFLEKVGISLAPMILGFIIGPMLEVNLQRALQSSKMDITPLFTRPISLIFVVITIVSLFWSIFGKQIKAVIKKTKA